MGRVGTNTILVEFKNKINKKKQIAYIIEKYQLPGIPRNIEIEET